MAKNLEIGIFTSAYIQEAQLGKDKTQKKRPKILAALVLVRILIMWPEMHGLRSIPKS